MDQFINIDEFVNRVELMRETVIQRMPEINQMMASEILGVVRRRVTTDGKNSVGQSFGTYSDNELPLFFYENKGLSNKGDAALVRAEEEDRGLSYEEWRIANGLQVKFKDFQFSGDTWRDMGVVSSENESGTVVTTVGPENKVSRKDGMTTSQLAGYLGDSNGNFLLPSESEEADLGISYEEQIFSLFQEVGLA